MILTLVQFRLVFPSLGKLLFPLHVRHFSKYQLRNKRNENQSIIIIIRFFVFPTARDRKDSVLFVFLFGQFKMSPTSTRITLISFSSTVTRSLREMLRPRSSVEVEDDATRVEGFAWCIYSDCSHNTSLVCVCPIAETEKASYITNTRQRIRQTGLTRSLRIGKVDCRNLIGFCNGYPNVRKT